MSKTNIAAAILLVDTRLDDTVKKYISKLQNDEIVFIDYPKNE
jgi:hypothetical protein